MRARLAGGAVEVAVWGGSLDGRPGVAAWGWQAWGRQAWGRQAWGRTRGGTSGVADAGLGPEFAGLVGGGACGVWEAGAAGGAGSAAAEDGADGGVGLVGQGRAVDVGLQVDRGSDRDGRADALFGGVDVGRDLRGGVGFADRDLGGDQERVRAYVHRPQVDDPQTSGPCSSAARIIRCISALADSPISRLLVSTARIAAATASSSADAQRARAVPAAVAGQRRQRHAGEREHQPDQRRGILEQDHGQFGRLGAPDEGAPATAAAHLVGLAHPGAQRERLEHRGQREHAVMPPKASAPAPGSGSCARRRRPRRSRRR